MNWKGFRTERSWSERVTHHRQNDVKRGVGGGGRLQSGAGYYCTAIGRIEGCFLIHTDLKHPAFRVACRERERCFQDGQWKLVIHQEILRKRSYPISSRNHLVVCGE